MKGGFSDILTQENRPNILKRIFSRSASPANSRSPSPLPRIFPSTIDPSGVLQPILPGLLVIAPSDEGASSSSAPGLYLPTVEALAYTSLLQNPSMMLNIPSHYLSRSLSVPIHFSVSMNGTNETKTIVLPRYSKKSPVPSNQRVSNPPWR